MLESISKKDASASGFKESGKAFYGKNGIKQHYKVVNRKSEGVNYEISGIDFYIILINMYCSYNPILCVF